MATYLFIHLNGSGMPRVDTSECTATIHAESIGGIEETEIDIPPGVTVLVGRNATNRTSFLQAIMAALGSNNVSLKGDAEEGRVALQIGADSYGRQLRRQSGAISFSGTPYLAEPELADIFAFLLESNPARRAVVQQQNLRELIMEPVDTDAIQAAINRLERERDAIDDQLDELSTLKSELPALEQRKQELDGEIEEIRDELDTKESKIEAAGTGVEKTQTENERLESKLTELRDHRTELESIRDEIDIQAESIRSLERDLSNLRDERADVADTPADSSDTLDQQIGRLRERKQRLESKVSNLQDIVQFNETMLDGGKTPVRTALETATGSDPTDQLVDSEQIVCWTCGTNVERRRIEETLETIRGVRQDQMSELRAVEADLEELRAKKTSREERKRRLEELDGEIEQLEDEIERRESRIESLRDQRDELTETVTAVEEEIEALESTADSAVLRLHRDANQLEYELGRLDSERADVADRIDTIESRIAEESELETQREQLSDELEAKRTEIDRIEQQAVEEFNERMAEILDILGYDNLSRIWIERVQTTATEGRQTIEQTAFELHVVRTTASGTAYEDTIDHLSESEREVTGLTFALAGYLVHDLHEEIPFMLLDSLEAIDSNRLADLVAYFGEYSPYLVVALLPGDAQALSEEYTRITEI